MIKELLEKGTNFAVVVSNPTFIGSRDYGGREYFLLLKKEDEPADLETEADENGLIQLDLSDEETEYFRKVSEELFNRVHHTSDGRVYELKTQSFKESI